MQANGERTQSLHDAAMAKAGDVCQHCLTVHSIPVADENFFDSRGFSIYDLPLFGELSDVTVNWDTITTETAFADGYAYIVGVAADYLRNGDVTCECES